MHSTEQVMPPLGLFFSLPSVSFPQLQSLPCLCCQYGLTNGSTHRYVSWDWSVNSGEMIMPVLQQHACWVGAPCSCSPLNLILFLEILHSFLAEILVHGKHTFFLGYPGHRQQCISHRWGITHMQQGLR